MKERLNFRIDTTAVAIDMDAGRASTSAQTPQFPLDLNRASVAELQSLPGIGPVKASAIVDYRTTRGDFRSIAELDSIHGIGPKTIAKIEPFLTISNDAKTKSPPN